ncbi:MAG: tRNA (N(6)-L-threonylcarbamoyladenosine(37)-C(2))-methylthiotransferase MtaB [Acetatifactor sp.]
MKKIAFHNLGCKVNSYEMDFVQQIMREKGYAVVPFEEKADIYIINTCTVTNIADRKSRQMIHRARTLNPQAVVVAMGCYVQTGREEALRDEGIDLAVGNNRKKDIARILEEYLQEREQARADKTLGGSTIIDIAHTREYEEMQLKETAEHTRAYVKIQDGCNQFCSYCIIPYARGRVRSRRREDILREVRGLAAAGYREVVLTGIHISSYGMDLNEDQNAGNRRRSDLAELVEELQRLEGLERIRLGSLEPRIVTGDFVSRLAACGKLCPHFHLSLQSGCDATLKRMNRRYTTGEYLYSVQLLRNAFDRPAITTDVIVGFPGETEEDFETCRRFLEQVEFYEMHIFKYSRRRGTAADRMPDQLPDAVKSRRSAILQQLEIIQSRAFRSKYIGQDVEVLFEEARETETGLCQVGYTRDYIRVALPGEVPLQGSLRRVRVTGFLNDEVLLAEPSQL